MTPLQIERVIKKLQKFVEEFNCWHLWVLIADIQKNNDRINPMFKNLKYAFLFPFSILHAVPVKLLI